MLPTAFPLDSIKSLQRFEVQHTNLIWKIIFISLRVGGYTTNHQQWRQKRKQSVWLKPRILWSCNAVSCQTSFLTQEGAVQRYKFWKCTAWEAQTSLAKLGSVANTAIHGDSEQKKKLITNISIRWASITSFFEEGKNSSAVCTQKFSSFLSSHWEFNQIQYNFLA